MQAQLRGTSLRLVRYTTFFKIIFTRGQMKNKEEENQNSEPLISLNEFLENHPPSQIVTVNNLYTINKDNYGEIHWYLNRPELNLHCSSDKCNGVRFFRNTESLKIELDVNKEKLVFLTYKCSNCQTSSKIFSVIVYPENEKIGKICKFGEIPFYGPPTPSKLINLIGPDREIFLKGRQCENQSLGIGAFIYYRRVVENQKKQNSNENFRCN
ncbi:hypothetical protein LEP1GSC195_0920 [Leptospira wolbachii serovar Codice str. CDC]|uniref:Uncharacterized protein n=2 Tax=Leptospira TaxID=171 RepID=R8ZYM2_9LEPT|nr:hypothetical protein LEP1GSC195_0920 [Leptospira wolbachii serovar Codice str. CDC]